MSDTELLNTSILSDTSSDDETLNDINVFEFEINGNKQICGLNKPQDRNKSKNPVNKDKVLNKKELEFMLKSIKKTANFARNTKIKEACQILYDADSQLDSNNNITNKKKCSFIQNSKQNGLECLSSKEQLNNNNKFLVNKMSKQETSCEDLTHKQLVQLAKIFNLQYKGKKNQICNNLVKYFNKNQNQLQKNECYKNIKSKCIKDNNCNWLFENKDLLIQRLQILDLLSNNKNHKINSCKLDSDKEYNKCSVQELLYKLRNTFNMKHLTSRCINKSSTEKTKIVIDNYKLIIFRETLKYFYNDKDNLDNILTPNEIDILNKIIDSFNTNNKHTTFDEFILYNNRYSIFNKILQNEIYLTNIINNICKIEPLSQSKENFLNNIFKTFQTFNLSNLQKIKDTNICNINNYNFQNDSDDDDTISSESLSESLSDTTDSDSILSQSLSDTTDNNSILSESISDSNNSETNNQTINTSIQTKIIPQQFFLQNNLVSRLFI